MSLGPGRVYVIGAGAIGASVGAMLYETGVDVAFVVDPSRGPHARALAERCVDLRFPTSGRRVVVPTVPNATPSAEDLVILATMGHHTADALAGLDPEVPVASFQNGVTPLQILVQRGHPTLAAMVWIPAERREPGVIALPGVPGPGTVILGPWTGPRAVHEPVAHGPHSRQRASQRSVQRRVRGRVVLERWAHGVGTPTSGPAGLAEWLASRLQAAGFTAEAEPDIAPWIRAKQLVNLGGIVVALCDQPPEDVIAAAQQEAAAVWTAAGLPFRTAAELLERVGPLETVPVDGRERRGGSTRSALARGDELETASLHGDVVQLGRTSGVPTPVNAALVAVAARAVAERRAPGSMSAAELRDELQRFTVA